MEEVKTIRTVKNKIIIALIGRRYSGKTTLLNSLIFPEIINNQNYIMTSGYDLRFLPINDNILIKFYDIGEMELQPNENIFQKLSWQAHYVIYLIDSKIKESLRYIAIFDEVFKKNKHIIVFNKIDQVQDKNIFNQDKSIQDFIKKYDIKHIYYVNSLDSGSVNNFKTSLFDLIKGDIINKVFDNINNEYFNDNLVLYHKPSLDFSKKINVKK